MAQWIQSGLGATLAGLLEFLPPTIFQPSNTTVNGDDEVVIGVTVKNNDGASAHFANVTVKLLDAAGDLADPAASITKAMGSVAASGTSADTWTFSITGIVAAYTDVLIIIDQSS